MRHNEFDREMTPAPRERKTKTADEALQSLMRLAARAERSSGDALRLMRTWGVAESDRQRVLQTLIEQRFIDDSRYADAYVREKSRLAGWGARKITLNLRQKGVTQDIIDQALQQLDSETVADRLADRLRRKAKSVKASNDYEFRAKLIRYGLSLGYDYEAIEDALKTVNIQKDR